MQTTICNNLNLDALADVRGTQMIVRIGISRVLVSVMCGVVCVVDRCCAHLLRTATVATAKPAYALLPSMAAMPPAATRPEIT